MPRGGIVSTEPRTQAVALAYVDPKRAPRVVAKGYGVTAEAIVQRARESGVYVHGSTHLVQLLMDVDLDTHIPPALYLAVAELLAWMHTVEAAAGTELIHGLPR
jgi:flagellar biosynthesis protein